MPENAFSQPLPETQCVKPNENRPRDTGDGEPIDPQKRREFPACKFDEPSDGLTTFTYCCTESLKQPTYVHDTAGGFFIVTRLDGTVERFRDNAVRHLVVEPDPQTTRFRPVVKNGQYVYLYLCREHREG
jgi:hypothetical protein